MPARNASPARAVPPPRASQTEGARSVRRAAALLRVVAMNGDSGASLTEVAHVCGLHKATAHRLLKVLFEEGLLELDAASKLYRLGAEIYSLSQAMGREFDIGALARPALESLARDTGDTAYLAVKSGYDGLCLGMAEGSYPEKALKLNVRDRWPLGVGAFSMAILAFLPEHEMLEIVRYNARRLTPEDQYTESKLLEQVGQTRKQGYAVTQLLTYPTMCAVGVPILDLHGRPIASLCVSAIVSRMTARRRQTIARKMAEEAEAVSARWSALRNEPGRDAKSWQTFARAVRTLNEPNEG